MWYSTNPDYDITRLVCSYISLNGGVSIYSGAKPPRKILLGNIYQRRTCSHSQCQIKINVWKRVKCER